MNKKTLVIHPVDLTTDFLSDIYKHRYDWTVITNPFEPKKNIKQAIKNHDRIIMMGHGTDCGLLRPNSCSYILDSKWLYLLREKELVAIWCNADKFFQKYNLKGFYTGMIISEEQEAKIWSVKTTKLEIQYSNTVFASCIRDNIDEPDFHSRVKQNYVSEPFDPVFDFNHQRIYFND